MTLRLCVIGNSHVAAIKLGWDQLQAAGDPRIAGITPTFFGAPRDGMKHVALREGLLVPVKADVTAHFQRLSGGRSEIDPALYDGFVLIGLGASFKRVLRLYRTHRWFGLRPSSGQTVVSRAFAEAFLAEGYGGTRLALLSATLAGLTKAPILAAPEPHWAAMAAAEGERKTDFGWARAAASGDAQALAEMFAQAMARALDPRVQLVLQPESTVENAIVTRAIYNKGASRMITGDGDETDAAHMNAAYGAEWWTMAAARLVPAAPVAKRAPARKRAG